MRDARLQDLRRRYLETRDVEAEASWIAGALRAGQLQRHRVPFAAYLGSPGARLVAPPRGGLEGLFQTEWNPDNPVGPGLLELRRALRPAGKVAAARVCAAAAGFVRAQLARRGGHFGLLRRFDRGLVPLQRCAAGVTGYVSIEAEERICEGLFRPYRYRAPEIRVEEWVCGIVLRGALECVRADGLYFKSSPASVLWAARAFLQEVLGEPDPAAGRVLRQVRDEVVPWALQPLVRKKRMRLKPASQNAKSPG